MRPALYFLLAFLLLPRVYPQSVQKDLKSELQGKTLFLRGLWKSDELRFDANGELLKASLTTSPFLSAFTVTQVQVKKDRLVVMGDRLSVFFQGDTLQSEKVGEEMRLEIAAPPGGDYHSALEAIVTTNFKEFAAGTPSYWVPCLLPSGERLGGVVSVPEKLPNPNIEMPKLLYSPAPDIPSKIAPGSNDVRMGLLIDQCGLPEDVHVVSSDFAKNDEGAVAAVRRWRFMPAMKAGLPVAVRMNISVTMEKK